jgi:hypothetical protein
VPQQVPLPAGFLSARIHEPGPVTAHTSLRCPVPRPRTDAAVPHLLLASKHCEEVMGHDSSGASS